jgi:hypothetical protein
MTVPGPTPTQRIEELTAKLQRLQSDFEKYTELTDYKLKVLQEEAADRKKAEDTLRDKLAEQTAKNAMLEERSRGQEKTSDRGWQLWLAALGFGFGLVSLLITAALQLKK